MFWLRNKKSIFRYKPVDYCVQQVSPVSPVYAIIFLTESFENSVDPNCLTLCCIPKKKKNAFKITLHAKSYGNSKSLVMSVYQKSLFLFLNQNICCGYPKEPSQ